MAKVQLIGNFITGGTSGEFYRYDSIVDEEIIPPRLRTPALIKPPAPPEEAGEEEIFVGEEEEFLEPPQPLPKRR